MPNSKKSKLVASVVAGLVSALTLLGIMAGMDGAWLATGGPFSLVAWLLTLVIGVATASFAWSFSGRDDEFADDGPESHHLVACAHCGGPIYPDWRLCPHCGERVSNEITESSEAFVAR